MKTDELTITGLLFSGIVLAGMWLQSSHQTNKQLLTLQDSYFQAMHIAVQLDEENKSIHNSIVSINGYVDELEAIVHDPELVKLIQIRRDLRGYSIEERATGYSVSWTESSFRLDPDHGDNGFTQGPCGVTEYHVDYLHSLGLNRFSYASCIEIYKLYKDKNSGSKELAIKSYKGIKQNTYLIEKYNSVRARVIKILKE